MVRSYKIWVNSGNIKYILNEHKQEHISIDQKLSSLKHFYFLFQELRLKVRSLFEYADIHKDRETIHAKWQRKHYVDHIQSLYHTNSLFDIYWFVQTYFIMKRHI